MIEAPKTNKYRFIQANYFLLKKLILTLKYKAPKTIICAFILKFVALLK